jgi:hypothetical protein
MATRLKTIEYAMPMYTGTTTDAVIYNFPQQTIYCPEMSGTVTWKSCTVEVGFGDVITATGGTITEHRVALSIGGAGATTITELDDIANTGENMSGAIGPFNFTAHFVANWTSGTSKTWDLGVYFDQSTGTTQGMTNVTAILRLTYEYDDTQTTHAQTVRIPFDSRVNSMATSLGAVIDTVPQLTGAGGFLEGLASVVVRDWYLVFEGNDANTSTTDSSGFFYKLNAEAWRQSGPIESALASSRWWRLVGSEKHAIPDTSVSHPVTGSMGGAVSLFHNLSAHLVVTFEYVPSLSSRAVQSVVIPMELASPIGVTTAAEASRFRRDLFVAEPGTITLLHSAVRVHYNVGAQVSGINVRAGAQAYRTYTHTGAANPGVCGMWNLQQRVDAGGVQGAGMTLARGRNTFTLDMYTTDTTDQMTNVSGYLLLNYSSDIATTGVGSHNHTVWWNLLQWDAALTDRNRINNYAVTIPETDFWVVSFGFVFIMWVSTLSQAVTFDVEVLSGESKGAGYEDLYADAFQSDAERGCTIVFMRGRDVFQRWPGDADEQRLDFGVSRDYRLFTTTTCSNGLYTLATYHSIVQWEVAGAITNSAGGTVTLHLHRDSTNEVVKTTTRSGNGAFAFTWYDDTEKVYVTAHESDTLIGRSASGYASAV